MCSKWEQQETERDAPTRTIDVIESHEQLLRYGTSALSCRFVCHSAHVTTDKFFLVLFLLLNCYELNLLAYHLWTYDQPIAEPLSRVFKMLVLHARIEPELSRNQMIFLHVAFVIYLRSFQDEPEHYVQIVCRLILQRSFMLIFFSVPA
jgi:hypothetical protein